MVISTAANVYAEHSVTGGKRNGMINTSNGKIKGFPVQIRNPFVNIMSAIIIYGGKYAY